MKKRILISEVERRQILSKHLKVGYNTFLFEQTTNYTIQDIQNKLNQAPFNAGLVADNRFGPKTSAAIVKALDTIKTGGVTSAPSTASTETTGSNTATTQTNTSTTGTNTSTTGTGTATTTTGTGTATTTTGTGTATTTTGSNTSTTGKEDPSSGD
jgi:hypothetical protein